LSFLLSVCSQAQKEKFHLEKTSEKIVYYDFIKPLTNVSSFITPIGNIGRSILYLYKGESIQFYLFDEENYTFSQAFNELEIEGRNFQFSASNTFVFYKQVHFTSMDDNGYSLLLLHHKETAYILDTIYNADKKIHSNFSTDDKFLIVNTLNTLSDYYNPNQDDRIMVYSLDSIRNGIVSKKVIPCKYCADGHLVGSNLFYTKSNIRDDFSDGFAWKDIYKSSWGNLKDSVKIAAFTEILAISPDGKYILGSRHFDLPNNPRVIIDVENKKHQLLLGRDYSKADAFYSFKEGKFAFDFGGNIVYVDYPKVYPFDALRRDNLDIPNWNDRKFYEQFEHKPFD
jgi:hypothetical protein